MTEHVPIQTETERGTNGIFVHGIAMTCDAYGAGFKYWALWALAIVLPAALIYIQFLHNPTIFDDNVLPLQELVAVDVDAFDARFVSWWSFRIGSPLGGDLLASARVGNLLVHLANGVLIGVISYRLLLLGGNNSADECYRISGFAGALFALHPMGAFATGYLIQRSIVLSLFFALLAVIFHLRAQLGKRPQWLLLAVVSFLLSVYSKEHSVALPGFLAALSYWLHRKGHAWKPWWSVVFIGYLAVAVAVAVKVSAGAGIGAIYEPQAATFTDLPDSPRLASTAAQMVSFFNYIGLWALPVPGMVAIDLQSDLIFRVLPWGGFFAGLGFVTIGLVCAWVVKIAHPASLLAMPLLWAQLLFVTEFWSIRIAEPFVLYRAYLWFPLLPLAVGYGVHVICRHLHLRVWAAPLALVLLLTVSGSFLYGRMAIFASEIAVWEEVVNANSGVQSQGAARGHYMLGLAYGNANRMDDAERALLNALNVNPKHSGALNNLGSIQFSRGQPGAAERYWREAIVADAGNPFPYFNLALIERGRGNLFNALRYEEMYRIAREALDSGAVTRMRRGKLSAMNEPGKDSPRE